MFEQKEIKFARTRSGVPALWKARKEFPTMIRYTYILGSDGRLKDAIYVRNDSQFTSELIPIREGDILLKIFYDSVGIGISVLRIVEVNPYSNSATVDVICRKDASADFYTYNPDAEPLSIATREAIDKIIYQTSIIIGLK